jgi:predicted nucleotidyltransferase
MTTSINSYLRNLSFEYYYLKNNSEEIMRIDASLNNLLNNLDKDLGILIKRRFVFGSYDRDTILPRKIDKNSDIDLMIVFNHTKYERTPETYRSWLKIFADKYYKERYGSVVVKSFPTVTIRLGAINYDLVPAKEEIFLSTSFLYIPSKSEGWQITNPNDVKNKLIQANTQYNSIVRPIIRLMKAWNCTNDYPYGSYELELFVTGLNYYGDDIQKGFFYAVGQLLTSYGDPQSKQDKVNSLKYNIGKVKDCLEQDDSVKAKQWLHRVLPN